VNRTHYLIDVVGDLILPTADLTLQLFWCRCWFRFIKQGTNNLITTRGLYSALCFLYFCLSYSNFPGTCFII